jgi:hypothetical protein
VSAPHADLVERLQVLDALEQPRVGVMVDLLVVNDGPVGATATRPVGDPLIVCPRVVPR